MMQLMVEKLMISKDKVISDKRMITEADVFGNGE